jgi:membrane associated rhomboid family serine protease
MCSGAYRRVVPTIRRVEAPGSGDDPPDHEHRDHEHQEEQPPGVPTRGVVVLAFIGVVTAGLLGALAAYGIVDVDCRGTCTTTAALAAVVGALVGTIGGAVVAILVLRARALWRVPR